MTGTDMREDLLRQLAPRVLGTLVRRYGGFDACEDAVQEALLAAAVQWPDQGVPDHPLSWLVTVASRRLTDTWRSDAARRQREDTLVAMAPPGEPVSPGPEVDDPGQFDDTLDLLVLCCHPELSRPSQMALTLRAVGGLSTAQIAHAFLVPKATMGQRISRAKQRIKATGSDFRMPPEQERDSRIPVVLHVLYLIFNEGYTATSGPGLHHIELTGEAIRIIRALHRLRPGDGEVAGLLALMLLTDARRPARTGPGSALVPLAEQDRTRWDHHLIAEGTALITHTLAQGPIGPYQLQAAIAALHDEPADARDTDWAQVVALYDLLQGLWPTPVVRFNRAIAVAMVRGPRVGLDLLDTLAADAQLITHHRLDAARAHLLEMAGDHPAARAAYARAARRTTSLPEQRYLDGRSQRLS